jgi:hypothetical protein
MGSPAEEAANQREATPLAGPVATERRRRRPEQAAKVVAIDGDEPDQAAHPDGKADQRRWRTALRRGNGCRPLPTRAVAHSDRPIVPQKELRPATGATSQRDDIVDRKRRDAVKALRTP